MNEKDGFKLKVTSSTKRSKEPVYIDDKVIPKMNFGGDTGIDADYEQAAADADENCISIKDVNKEIAKDYKYEHDQISEMVLPDEIIVESVVNVKDANYTRYYDKELGIWFCKFCEQQIVGD